MRKQKKYHFIYKTTNLLNSRYYLGMHSTNDLEDGYLGSGTYLKRSLNKHGKENHILEIIEFCKTRKELISKEKTLVNLKEIAKKDCMNLNVGGGTYNHTEETKKKISQFGIEYYKTHKHPRLGITHTKESRKKMSDALKGRIVWNKGKTGLQFHTEESKKKIGDASKGRISWNKGIKMGKQKVIKCPYCDKTGGNNMKRYHFDNCKKYNT